MVDKVWELKFDVIIMDVEMFVFDGISVVKEIMVVIFMFILMFLLFICDGVIVIFDVLDVGVFDFLLKKFEDIVCNNEDVIVLL